MATKQELEVQVAELQKQISEQTPADVAALQSEISNLKEQLTSKSAREASLTVERDSLRKENLENINTIRDLSERVSKMASERSTNSGIILDGSRYEVVRRDRAVDLVTAWRGRFVEDDDIVVVLKKV